MLLFAPDPIISPRLGMTHEVVLFYPHISTKCALLHMQPLPRLLFLQMSGARLLVITRKPSLVHPCKPSIHLKTHSAATMRHSLLLTPRIADVQLAMFLVVAISLTSVAFHRLIGPVLRACLEPIRPTRPAINAFLAQMAPYPVLAMVSVIRALQTHMPIATRIIPQMRTLSVVLVLQTRNLPPGRQARRHASANHSFFNLQLPKSMAIILSRPHGAVLLAFH